MKNIIIISAIFISFSALGSEDVLGGWETLEEKSKFCREYAPRLKDDIDRKKDKATPLEIRQTSALFFEGGIHDQDIEYIEQARIYIDRFFESVEHATIADDWRVAARIYSNAGNLNQDPELSLIYGRKAANFWKQYFKESKPSAIENMDYANCAVTHNNLGFDAKDFDEKENSFAQAAQYWDQYLLKSGDYSIALRERGHAYNNAAFWAMSLENRAIFSKKSAYFWTLFLRETPDLTLEDISNVINAYQAAVPYETASKQAEYRKKIHELSFTYKISHVFQLGNDVLFFVESEIKTLVQKDPLILMLPPEEESPKEDLEIVKKKKKKKKKSGVLKISTLPIENVPEEDEQEIIQEETSQAPHLIDEPEAVMFPVEKESQTLDAQKQFQKQAPKPTKSEKRLLRQKNESTIPEGHLQKETTGAMREYTVDSLTVMQIRKAYEKEKSKEEAISILDASLSLESGTSERTILSHISKLKKYFSVRKNDDSEKTVILGHNVPDFYFHSAHGNRQGDWDAGMIRRLKSFVRDIKITFEAIIK